MKNSNYLKWFLKHGGKNIKFEELSYPIFFNEYHRKSSILAVEKWWHKFKNTSLMQAVVNKYVIA